MIPKGLNVGDTFEDGGFLYVVEDLCDIGYISRRLSNDDLSKEENLEQEESVEKTDLPKEEKPESRRGRKPRKEQGQ